MLKNDFKMRNTSVVHLQLFLTGSEDASKMINQNFDASYNNYKGLMSLFSFIFNVNLAPGHAT